MSAPRDPAPPNAPRPPRSVRLPTLAHWAALRRVTHPQSLRVQLALGSALVALIAVALVAGISLFTVTLTFNAYARVQLSSEVARYATTLGQAATPGTALVPPASSFGHGVSAARASGATSEWIMDTSGRLLVAPVVIANDPLALRDADTVEQALRQALHGQTTEAALPSSGLLTITGHLYATAPIYLSGTSQNQIIGAVGLSSPQRADRTTLFATGVARMMLFVALGVALLAAAAAWFFSRWLTRPVAGVAHATARMAAGDYAARVAPRGPEELRLLGRSFNEMAATLQRDVGELHRQEQLRRELVADVSHELATPLTAIQGFTEALLDGVVSEEPERTQTIRLVAREAARLRRLVDQLRRVSLYEGDGATLERTAVALPALLEETLNVLEPELTRKHLTVTNRLPPDLPPVFADADRLTEIVLNLLDNAVRHTPLDGAIALSGADQGEHVAVSIANSGPGIAPEDRGRIFERFYRVDASRSSATGGTGLGLSIVRALVEAHGGTIAVESPASGGTVFTVTLPVAEQGAISPAGAPLARAPRTEPAPRSSSRPLANSAPPRRP